MIIEHDIKKIIDGLPRYAFSGKSSTKSIDDCSNLLGNIITKFKNGDDLYFKLTSNRKDKREGLIGKLSQNSFMYNDPFNNSQNHYSKRILINKIINASQLTLCFDDRKKSLNFKLLDSIYMEDYSGPTVWKDRIIEKKIIKDALGIIIKVDDLISYVTSNNYNYGYVTKITPAGNIMCNDVIKNKKVRIDKPSRCLVVNDMKNKIMSYKLKHEI